ncbi:hypothetical protein [Parvularcula sp. LCG005]|uniref:hypothetical protein n=1 Tax=Parvularcula sp. LCG005 TaxID=3078805 RepID=UPI00294393FD|nr:hypothetical protein [Parvularcula sp. LCG005]WOI52136.1 hypothetical protein RUI03_08200 [Parvularcula sp. LCG005]
MIRTPLILAAALCAATALPAAAQDIAVDGSLGTTGIGAHVQWKPINRVVLRGGYSYLNFTRDDQEYDGVEYDAEMDFQMPSGFVDLHPFENGFTLTGGVYLGEKMADLTANPDENVTVGDLTFTPEQIGILNARADFEDTAPYLGVGWDNALYGDGGISLFARLGVMFTGSPEVSMTASGGTLSNEAIVQEALADEEAELKDDIEDYDLYPVINVGVSFSF